MRSRSFRFSNNLTFPYMIILIFATEYRLWSSSLHSFPQPLINSSLLDPNTSQIFQYKKIITHKIILNEKW
jgi:hypothetical protein